MNSWDINVTDIAIINQFSSTDNEFRFENNHRKWDGFVYFAEGEGSFRDSEGNDFEIKKSSLVLLRADDSYSFSVKPGYRYIVSAYSLSDRENALSRLPKVISCTETEGIIIENIYHSWQRKAWSSLNCKIQILSLYLELLKKYSSSEHVDIHVNRAVDFINRHFRRNFSSSEIADYCGLSESHLRAKFQSALGMTITDYRELLRTEEAKKMLTYLNFSPKAVAYELGYSDVYHFTKAFKAKAGITPAKYSKSSLKD